MRLKLAFVINLLIVAGMFALSAWAWYQLPSRIPVRFDLDGTPTRYGGKFEELLLMPIITAATAVILALLPRIEPRRQHLMRSSKAYSITWIATVVFLGSIHVTTVASALGSSLNFIMILGVLAGSFLIVIGNYLSKTRSTFFFGIRTPWTLSSELSWQKTHRLGGWLLVLHGVALIISGLIANAIFFGFVNVSLIIVSLLVLPVYSYLVWKGDRTQQTINGNE